MTYDILHCDYSQLNHSILYETKHRNKTPYICSVNYRQIFRYRFCTQFNHISKWYCYGIQTKWRNLFAINTKFQPLAFFWSLPSYFITFTLLCLGYISLHYIPFSPSHWISVRGFLFVSLANTANELATQLWLLNINCYRRFPKHVKLMRLYSRRLNEAFGSKFSDYQIRTEAQKIQFENITVELPCW